MDIEVAIREHPALGIPFLLSAVLSGCLAFAFVMQWNQYSMLKQQWRGVREEWKKGSRWKTALRWYFFGSFIAAARIWKESVGMRFILPLSVALGAIAWFFYKALERVSVS